MVLWDKLVQAIVLLIILSILVIAHEWGHFIVARLCGIRVDDFSIGFGKRLFRIAKRGDTEYNVRMLPLGGFVKIAGMEPDEAPFVAAKEKVLGKSNDPDPDSTQIPLVAENVGENSAYTAPDGFYSKPLWQRSLVILAGPVMSFLTGYIVFCLMGATVGVPSGKVLSRISMVEPGGEGQRIGLHAGDVIAAINGTRINDGQEMVALIHGNLGKALTLTVQHEGTTFTRVATPRVLMQEGKPVINTDVVQSGTFGAHIGLKPGDTIYALGSGKNKDSDASDPLALLRRSAGQSVDILVSRPTSDDLIPLHGTLPAAISPGVLPTLKAHEIGVLQIEPAVEIKHLGLMESIKKGNIITAALFQQLGKMVMRPKQLKENTGGIIFMYTATGVAVKNGLVDEVALMAQLSISLAIFNLLPIPILDGGHLLTFFIEWLRRGKRLNEQQQQAFLMTGLAIIGILFVLINSHDIIRTIKHQLPQ